MFFKYIFSCFCLYHSLFTSSLSITPDFTEFITDLFQIVSDFVISYPGPDCDYLGANSIYLRLYCHDPAELSVKQIYLTLFDRYRCY